MTPYTLKIRSGCEGGSKGALIQTDMSATLSTLNDQYLFQPVIDCHILDDQGGSQISVRDDGKSPTLRAEMHGNVPCVMDAKTWDSRDNGDGKVVSTITGGHECSISDYTSLVMQPIPIHDQATRFSGKRGDNHDGKGNGLGVGNPGDHMNTLTSGDRHAVCYTLSHGGFMVNPSDDGVADTPQATDYKDPQVVAIDRAFFNQGQNAKYDPQFYTDGTVPTLVARGPSAVAIRYIVRRLTPTECARLQGFPDTWGHPIEKTEFTDEEYQFWLNVRNTHAVINDKATKEYTKEQILKWYNGLHTDSSEYKMWGNGIALPNALYMMQGIADVMTEEKVARRKWLDELLGGCL
jgi:DNA (cytosine-5)-methyltransferase 1